MQIQGANAAQGTTGETWLANALMFLLCNHVGWLEHYSPSERSGLTERILCRGCHHITRSLLLIRISSFVKLQTLFFAYSFAYHESS
jgi:hypothetical protein